MKGEKRGREGEMEKGGEKGGLAGEGEKYAAKSGQYYCPTNGRKRNASLTTRAHNKEGNRIESGVMDIAGIKCRGKERTLADRIRG